MNHVEIMFAFELRRQNDDKLVEPIAVFPSYVYDVCDDDDEYDMSIIGEIELVDSIRSALEGVVGAKIFGLDVGDVWVTHVPTEFNRLTFDINGKTYFCVQNLDPDVIESLCKE